MRPKKLLTKITLALFIFSFFQGLFLFHPQKLNSASLTAASATLANPRISFYGKVNGVHLKDVTTIATDASDNPDNTTNHLFPGDPISVGPNGSLTVGTIIGVNNFAMTSGLIEGVSDQATIYATQSGALTVVFTITNDIPAAGYITVVIPDAAAGFNDGAPDTAASVALNGFDFNGMAKTDVVTTGGTLLKVIDIVSRAGYVVDVVTTVVDREEGGAEALAARGCILAPLFTRTSLLA